MKILNEDAQYTSRKKAAEYLVNSNFFGNTSNVEIYGGGENDVDKAIDYYLRFELRSRIPSLRTPKGGKYIFGCVRIIHEEGLPKNEYKKLNKIIHTIVGDEILYKGIDNNFNGMEFDDIYDKIMGYISQFGEINSHTHTGNVKNVKYRVINIKDYEEASKFGDYADWCITNNEYLYNAYTEEGEKTVYFILSDNYKEFPQTKEWIDEHKDCVYNDEYGTSMICVIVDDEGNITDSISRYNLEVIPDSKNVQRSFTEEEIEELLDCSFGKVFPPKANNKGKLRNFIKANEDILTYVEEWFDEKGDNKYNIEEYTELDTDFGQVYVMCNKINSKNEDLYKLTLKIPNENHKLNILYNKKGNNYETPWCRDVKIFKNILVYDFNDNYTNSVYIKKLGENKLINKRPFNYINVNRNTLIAFDSNNRIKLFDIETCENIELDIFSNKQNVLKSPYSKYIIVGSMNEDVMNFRLVDSDKNKLLDKPMFAKIPSSHTFCPLILNNMIVFSYNKNLSDAYVYNMDNGEKTEIPYYGEIVKNDSIYTLFEKGGKSFLLNIENGKVLFKDEEIRDVVYTSEDKKSVIVKYEDDHYAVIKGDKVYIDDITTIVDVYSGILILKNKKNKFAVLYLDNFTLYYESDIDDEWFVDYKKLEGINTLFMLGNNGENYRVPKHSF